MNYISCLLTWRNSWCRTSTPTMCSAHV